MILFPIAWLVLIAVLLLARFHASPKYTFVTVWMAAFLFAGIVTGKLVW